MSDTIQENLESNESNESHNESNESNESNDEKNTHAVKKKKISIELNKKEEFSDDTVSTIQDESRSESDESVDKKKSSVEKENEKKKEEFSDDSMSTIQDESRSESDESVDQKVKSKSSSVEKENKENKKVKKDKTTTKKDKTKNTTPTKTKINTNNKKTNTKLKTNQSNTLLKSHISTLINLAYRPFSIQDIQLHFKNTHKKKDILTILTDLIQSKSIIEKKYNKTSLYYFNYTYETKEDFSILKNTISVLKKDIQSHTHKNKHLLSYPPDNDLQIKIHTLKQTLSNNKNEIQRIKDNNLNEEEYLKIKNELNNLKRMKKERKSILKNVVDGLVDGMNMKKKEIIEEVGLSSIE